MKKYCVGVSGGSDSMTLLDQCVKKKMNIIVAHVNYQKRATAWRDEKIVHDYCEKNHVPFFVKYCDPHYQGNFQDYARQFRYDFFHELCEKENCDSVLVAHQQDDLLETYLMQCQRKSIPLYYGLASSTKHHQVMIERPLLSLTKQDCYDYCEKNHLEFGEDESNFQDDYLRNRIRKEIINSLTPEKRQSLLDEIKQKNDIKMKHDEKIKQIAVLLGEDISIAEFKKLEEPEDVLREWLNNHNIGYDISERRLSLICKTIKQDKSNYQFEIDHVTLMKSYDVIQLVEDVEYSYTFDSIQEFDCPYFKIRTQGESVNAVTLSEKDFPITIRSPKPNDAIQLRYGKKKINRFFIDRKISHKERKIYPIVVNCSQNIVLVPKIGCDVEHYTVKANCFVIK
ncbi:MAG: tRNA lysidine(34) synthetase TilS [Traorella sp.]